MYNSQHIARESKQAQDCNEKNAHTQPRQIKRNQNVLLNCMQRLKPQNLLHKWQKLTKTQRQLTITTKENKSNYLQSEASEVSWNNKCYESVNMHFGRCSNQVSAGMMEKLTDTNKNNCTLAAKSETQKR